MVARALDAIRAVLAEFGTRDTAGDPHPAARLGAELDRLIGELNAHLDYAEEQLVPVLNAMITMPEGI